MKSYPESPLMNEEFFGVMDLAMQAIALFGSPEMLMVPHGDVETAAVLKAREFGRLLIQANFRMRTQAERKVEVKGSDGGAALLKQEGARPSLSRRDC